MKSGLMPIIAGIVFGVLAPVLVYFGNPGNMGICAACFTRDIAGALNLHQASIVQYIRPEVIGLIFGSMLAAVIFKEFSPRGGSSPLARFALGFFAMIGALVFLGCPWRMILRLSAGDLSALAGLFGFIVGILLGLNFFKRGFSLGRNYRTSTIVGLLFPLCALTLLGLLIIGKLDSSSFVKFSSTGPGSMHAPVLLSIVAGLVLGFLLQKSRFCTISAIRDVVILKDAHLLKGVLAFFITALIVNMIFGFFKLGFENQPIAHNDMLWNFLGMLLSALALTLAGGCPGRQLILSGEGDSDAGVFMFGLLVGAAFAHNFALAASPKGIGENTSLVVIIGLVFCVILGIFAKERQ